MTQTLFHNMNDQLHYLITSSEILDNGPKHLSSQRYVINTGQFILNIKKLTSVIRLQNWRED